jgi:hypothetical protein
MMQSCITPKGYQLPNFEENEIQTIFFFSLINDRISNQHHLNDFLVFCKQLIFSCLRY